MKTAGKFNVFAAVLLVAIISVVCVTAAPFATSLTSVFAEALLSPYVSENSYDGTILLSWSPVSGADTYTVYVNGNSVVSLPSVLTSFDLTSVFVVGGNYLIEVAALAGGVETARESVSYDHFVTLQSPDGLAVEDGKLVWQAVAGADRYAVSINGIDVCTTESLFITLSNYIGMTGDYTARIIAISDSEFYEDSAPAILTFRHVMPPIPLFTLELSKVGTQYLLSWPKYAEHAGATYRYYVTVDGVAQDPVDTESNCVSVNHLINGDGTYAFSVAAVKEGVASRYYTRVFRITDGMVTAI